MDLRCIGNSYYLLVPKDVLDRLGWSLEDFINLDVDLMDGSLTYRKVEYESEDFF
jgi:hypothetical protein